MLLKEIETKEIKEIIEQIKPNSKIHPKVIKQTAPYINKILCHIFNSTIQTGIIPSSLKISFITPIFKSENNISMDSEIIGQLTWPLMN